MKNALLILSLIALVACGEKKEKKAQKEPEKVYSASISKEGASYRFKGLDGDGKKCDTGPRSFRDERAFCAQLLLEKENGSCELIERIKTFTNLCEPLGFHAYGSVSCDVMLLKEGASSNGSLYELPPQDDSVIFSANYCAGIDDNGARLSLNTGGPIGNVGISLAVHGGSNVTWTPENLDAPTSFIIEFLYAHQLPPDDHRLDFLKFEFKRPWIAVSSGTLPNTKYDKYVRCRTVHACNSRAQ
ncbi:MAG: hypothetical protein AB7O96_17210 [Pseudobdellovibrionaceae bacterium]